MQESRRTRVLVVEDDETVADIVTRYMEREEFAVDSVADGESALEAIDACEPDLVVLDVMLPKLSGFEVCRRLQARRLPIVMLTARGEESDRIMGLELGADDYVVKPFSPRELVARVRSVLRRAGPRRHGEPIATDSIVLDPRSRSVTVDGRAVDLTTREFDLLAFLMQHPGQVFDRAELLEQVWGYTFGSTPTVTVHVQRLRRKIERDPEHPEHVTTVWGSGYRFDS
ncbi:MAG TPA: response regulator transcription factor [Gaiellaceae bacterium]|nr:response regulator transcription factor [Gaiellaceae bacterium]